MTGEMSKWDAHNKEEWAIHREIAQFLKGTLLPYDTSLGPYIEKEGKSYWIIDHPAQRKDPSETIAEVYEATTCAAYVYHRLVEENGPAVFWWRQPSPHSLGERFELVDPATGQVIPDAECDPPSGWCIEWDG